jgi:hypothetical protein
MPVEVRIIPITKFLLTDASGTLMETSLILLRDLLQACKEHNVDRLLIDTREATSSASVLDAWTLASNLTHSELSPKDRVAVLNRPEDDFDGAASLELCPTNRGYQLKAFHDFEAAFTWLNEGEPSTSSSHKRLGVGEGRELPSSLYLDE